MAHRVWGFSSVGRAPALQAGCQRFESANLHQQKPPIKGQGDVDLMIQMKTLASFLSIDKVEKTLDSLQLREEFSSSAENLDNCIGLERKHLMDA